MSSNKATFLSRVVNELSMMKEPPPGIQIWPLNDSMQLYHAIIIGPEESPYEGGEFKLSINLPDRYPFEPPTCRFMTKIYHPNIDEGGRICLDTLSMPPKGSWKPSLNISTLLTTVRLLMSAPNPEDPLVVEISEEFVSNYPAFVAKARATTKQYATPSSTPSNNTEHADLTTASVIDQSPDKKQNIDYSNLSQSNLFPSTSVHSRRSSKPLDSSHDKIDYTHKNNSTIGNVIEKIEEKEKLNKKKRPFEETSDSDQNSDPEIESSYDIDKQGEGYLKLQAKRKKL